MTAASYKLGDGSKRAVHITWKITKPRLVRYIGRIELIIRVPISEQIFPSQLYEECSKLAAAARVTFKLKQVYGVYGGESRKLGRWETRYATFDLVGVYLYTYYSSMESSDF